MTNESNNLQPNVKRKYWYIKWSVLSVYKFKRKNIKTKYKYKKRNSLNMELEAKSPV